MLMSQSTNPQITPPSLPNTHPRPFGLRVIIALFFLKAIIFVTFFVILVIAAYETRSVMSVFQSMLTQMPTTLISFILLTPLSVIVAIGLWRRKRWAWVLTMAILAYSMAIDIMSYLDGQAIWLSMALNVIQVGYLNQKEVQDLFGEGHVREA